MREFSKKTWFEELNEITRAEYLVEGPVKVKFNNGKVLLKMDVEVKEKSDNFYTECNFSTDLLPKDYHQKMRLATEMLNTVGREDKKNAQWRIFGTTEADLARAKILNIAKNVKISVDDLM